MWWYMNDAIGRQLLQPTTFGSRRAELAVDPISIMIPLIRITQLYRD